VNHLVNEYDLLHCQRLFHHHYYKKLTDQDFDNAREDMLVILNDNNNMHEIKRACGEGYGEGEGGEEWLNFSRQVQHYSSSQCLKFIWSTVPSFGSSSWFAGLISVQWPQCLGGGIGDIIESVVPLSLDLGWTYKHSWVT